MSQPRPAEALMTAPAGPEAATVLGVPAAGAAAPRTRVDWANVLAPTSGAPRHDARDAEIQMLRTQLAQARMERDVIVNSTLWRMMNPLRALGRTFPSGLRRLMRRMLRHRPTPAEAATSPTLDMSADFRHVVSAPAYAAWIRDCETLSDADRAAIRDHIARLAARPLISVVMPAYETPERLLREAIASVKAQFYPHWELCIADDASPSATVQRVAMEEAAADPRIKFVRRATNGNISAATNAALALATGEFVALMDHDDILPERALYEVAVELNAYPDADMIYSDEDHIDEAGRRHTPYFKPGWNVDLMLGHNVFSHLGVYRREIVQRLGGLRIGFEGSQDYDLALRVAAATTDAAIRHIPAILYHWRQLPTSFSQSRTDACVAAARRAVSEFLDASGAADRYRLMASPDVPTWTRVQWLLPEHPPRVSLIVPTRDRADLLERCVDGILNRTDYPDIELIVMDNESQEAETRDLFARLARDQRVRIIAFPGAFNYSAINNAAASVATGDILLLINNDIDVIEPLWLREMVGHALRPQVGAVGARLLYANRTIQHAGVALGVCGFEDGPGVAGHYGTETDAKDPGYFGQSALTREVAAVTGACLAVRKSVFEAVGGLDAEHLSIAFNDIDLCLRIRASGLRVVWTPFAELYHLESASRGFDLDPGKIDRFRREYRTMRERWGPVLDNDPFYNINFSRFDAAFRLAAPCPRIQPWRSV